MKMTIDNLTITKAVPSDAAAAAPLLYATAPEYFDYLFNIKTKSQAEVLEFLQRAFRSEKGLFSYRQTLLAQVDGQTLGLIRIFDTQSYKKAAGSMTGIAVRFYGPLTALKLIPRGWTMDQLIPPLESNALLVYQLAVAPEVRGMGIGSRLLEEAFRRANAEKKDLYIDVAETNLEAKALYERSGFEITNYFRVSTPDSPAFLPSSFRLRYREVKKNEEPVSWTPHRYSHLLPRI